MSKPLHPLALFRLSVLGPVVSRGQIKRGEIIAIIRGLAKEAYNIPRSRRTHLSEETILRWYYLWRRGGIDALAPQTRCDKGNSQLSVEVKEALKQCKQDNPARSINTIISIVKSQGLVAKGELARATVHRYLQSENLSKRIPEDRYTIERRSFVAAHAGDIWQGDVLHGPSIQTPNGMRKVYLVSLLDDASRLIAHSAFCLGETALDIEGVLKQAILKRGLPHKLIIDNGPAYRSHTLQSICARLDINLIYCRPYEPEGKGKLERFHRTFRDQFLNEIEIDKIAELRELNERLWAWLECVYHARKHEGLDDKTPLERWRDDVHHVRQLGFKALKIDDIFYHREERTVKKDGTVSWEGKLFEVDYAQAEKKVQLVFDPHNHRAIRIESESGADLGPIVLLDKNANLDRKRQRPHRSQTTTQKQVEYAVEIAFNEYSRRCGLPVTAKKTQEEEK